MTKDSCPFLPVTKRDKHITIKLDQNEMYLVKECSKKEKLTMSDFIRRCIGYYVLKNI